MQYTVARGLINGKTETALNPQDLATRAEIAVIFQRFIEGNKYKSSKQKPTEAQFVYSQIVPLFLCGKAA